MRRKRNGRYTEIMYREGNVRIYSHVAILGSQFSSISATSILVVDRTFAVDGPAIYL